MTTTDRHDRLASAVSLAAGLHVGREIEAVWPDSSVTLDDVDLTTRKGRRIVNTRHVVDHHDGTCAFVRFGPEGWTVIECNRGEIVREWTGDVLAEAAAVLA